MTTLEKWIGDFVEVRILGPHGGVQVGSILQEITNEDGSIDEHLLRLGDAVLLRDAPVEMTDDGTLRLDWTHHTAMEEFIRQVARAAEVEVEVEEDVYRLELKPEGEEDDEDPDMRTR